MFGCGSDFLSHSGGFALFVLTAAFSSLLTFLLLRPKMTRPRNMDKIDSLEILKLRLAKGDITLEEYNLLKSVL